MTEYKKSYLGLILWMVAFPAAMVLLAYLPTEDGVLLSLLLSNLLSLGVTTLLLMAWLLDKPYWYNGITFEAARSASPEARRNFTFRFFKPFAVFSAGYLLFSVPAYLVHTPPWVNVALATLGIVVAAITTVKIHLEE